MAELVLFAPAIMDIAPVISDQTSAYVHFTGPFQSTSRRGDRLDCRNLGPLPAAEVEDLVATLKEALHLPVVPLEVAYDELVSHPELYCNRIVRSRGPWQRGDSRSDFAGACLVPPDRWNIYGDDASSPGGVTGVTIDVVGLWADTAAARTGHFPAVLEAYLLEVLPDLGEIHRLAVGEPDYLAVAAA